MFPDFLCIGAQKSGTSWLQVNMRDHPGIWLPPIKEVHYLDQRTGGAFKSLFSSSKRARKGRIYLKEQMRALLHGGSMKDLRWALHYCFAPRNDAWYSALFPENSGKITGEICPGYARLRDDGVERVYRLMPRAKIIYFMRNPVDRAWSYASQHFSSPRGKGRHGGPDNVPAEQLRAFFLKDSTSHSDFLGALESWQRYYSEEQMLVCYFDELATDPRSLLKRILDFIGADSADQYLPSSVAEKRNRSRGSTMTSATRVHLTRLHYDQLRALHARLNNSWTARWLTSAEEVLETGGSRIGEGSIQEV